MAGSDQEIEAKFLLHDPSRLAARLETLGAPVTAVRVHEVNLRFDTPDGALT